MADDNTKLIIVLEAQSKKLQNSLVQVNKQISNFAAATERRFEQMNARNAKSFESLGSKIKGSLGGLQNVFGPLIGAIGIREVIRFSDAWTDAGNKIAAAGVVSGIQARSLDQLKDSANGARTGLEEYVDLYARLLRVAPSISASEKDVAQATDIVAKSLKAGGASAQEQTASLIQLGQALGSGALQGDELRSIRENAPLVAKAIAKEFGVSIGELKALGAEGKLTSDRVFKALINAQDDIQAAFNATRSTIKDAFTRINNEFTAYIGTSGQATGATQALIDALNFLAEHFTEVANVVVQFATVLGGALAGKAIAGVVVGIGEAIGALGAFIVALRTGTLAAGGFTAALGPIGIIAGLAAAAIFLLWNAQEDGKRAADAHAKAMAETADKIEVAKDASVEFRQALRDQIAMQVEAAKAALTEADAQTAAARAKAASQRINILGMTFGNAFSEADANAALTKSLAMDAALQQLEAQLARIDSVIKTPAKKTKTTTGSGAGSQNDYDKATESILKKTAALQAETAAQATLNPLVNDYGFALERAKAAQDLLQAAQDAGLAITPELKASIDALATGYANASVEAKKLGETQDEVKQKAGELRDALKSVTSGFINDLLAGKSAAESLGNALSDVGNRLIGLGLDTLFGTGQGSSPFGAIGKLFGFADGGIAAHGQPVPLPTFAKGGVSRSASIFGEAGPEAAVPLPDGRRIPVDLRMPHGSGGGSVSVPISIRVDATGADAAGLARVEGQLARMRAELPSTVISTVKAAKSRRIL